MTVGPPAFGTPVVSPLIGGYGLTVPYLSVSQYKAAPTAVDTTNLIEDRGQTEQDVALADLLRRASGIADLIVFGPDAASKSASLCATQCVEAAAVKVLGGAVRLVCSYKPVLELTGMSTGSSASAQTPLPDASGAAADLSEQVITIPMPGASSGIGRGAPTRSDGRLYVVWSYVAGYPHTSLAADLQVGATSAEVGATGPTANVLGIYPNRTQMRIVDGAQTETVTVTSVAGTTLGITPTAYAHTVPAAPDFLPVTALPSSVEQALIMLTSSLVKERGSTGIQIATWDQPGTPASPGKPTSDGVDLTEAKDLLMPFAVVNRTRN